MINTIIVNAAWPATNDATSGTYAEPNATSGSSIHSTTGSTPTISITTAPSTNPTVVPATARSTRVPVVSALLRNTDIAPSTTQNPCSTGNTCVTATASAKPSPVRRLFRSTTALVARNPLVMAATATVSGITQSAAPVAGRRRPSTRAQTGRASAAAALRMIRPVTAIVAEMVRRFSSLRHISTAASSSASLSNCDDVVAVGALRHRTQLGQRLRKVGAACRPFGGDRNAEHPSRVAQHPHRGIPHLT